MISVLVLKIFTTLLFLKIIPGDECDDLSCSNFNDYVCGMVKYENRMDVTKYQNICHLEKNKCSFNGSADVVQVSNDLCGLENATQKSRRVNDFSIVGAYQVCNHSCPTHCTDAYEPTCAEIYKKHDPRLTKTLKVMVNHCHVDLFSCVTGANVTLSPLSKCYSNANTIIFMKQVAALKSLHLISRKSSSVNNTEWLIAIDNILKDQMSDKENPVNLTLLKVDGKTIIKEIT